MEKRETIETSSSEKKESAMIESKEGGFDRREEVIRLLSEKGIEDPEARKALDTWTAEREMEVDKEGPVSRIGLEIEIAGVCFYGGCDADDVLDMLYSTLEIAKGERLTEFEEKLRVVIRRIEGYEGEDSASARRLIAFRP